MSTYGYIPNYYSGVLINSGEILLSNFYVNFNGNKTFFEGNLYSSSGQIVLSDKHLNSRLLELRSFNNGILINSGNILLAGKEYVKINPYRTFTDASMVSTTARPGLSTDDAILIVNGFYTDFTASSRTIYTDQSITFIDYTYGPEISSWFWDFGDGSTSIEQHPSHTYVFAGLYSVELIVTSINGEQAISRKLDYINVIKQVIGTKKIYPVAANQRVTAYKAGTTDKIQIKLQLYSDIKTKLSYLEGATVTLKLNYNGSWRSYEVSETDKFGGYTFYHSCEDVDVNNCLGYVTVNINNEIYRSNLIRINFI